MSLSMSGSNNTSPIIAHDRQASIRRWALVALVAHVLFVFSWLVAALWQGPRYSVLAHSISDMYAVGAPNGAFLVIMITLCGVAAILFTLLSVWPSLRPGGWTVAVGSLLLVFSIFGVGNLLTAFERLACRRADPGCTATAQLTNFGGRLDAILSTIGVLLFVAAGFFLASAMKRTPGWHGWAWPARWVMILIIVLYIATGVLGAVGLSGLFERLLAATGAAGVALLAVGVLQRYPA